MNIAFLGSTMEVIPVNLIFAEGFGGGGGGSGGGGGGFSPNELRTQIDSYGFAVVSAANAVVSATQALTHIQAVIQLPLCFILQIYLTKGLKTSSKRLHVKERTLTLSHSTAHFRPGGNGG